MRTVFLISWLAVVGTGCTRPQRAVQIPRAEPALASSEYRPEHDSEFTQHERALISAARRFLERREHRTVDAYYRIRYTFSGIEVIAEYVSTYKDNEPVFDKW